MVTLEQREKQQKLESKDDKKTTVWILQTTNREDYTQENLNRVKKEKLQERN